MSADHDPVDELLASISDGRAPDWAAVERGTEPAQQERIASLKAVSRIADFSRGLQQSAAESAAPERWGDLLLLERLGAGSHAEVYRAWDPRLRREVALKLLRSGVDDSALLDEGRTAARIRHPHVVTIHGIDRRDGRVGLWMELVRGASLEQQVRAQGPLDVATVQRIGIEIGSALVAVHAAGLRHRDVKPANVMRDAEGHFVLADFGLGQDGEREERWSFCPSGTPMYMAPELFAGAPASERSDVYSLGLLLWFALAGRHPFAVDTLAELNAQASRGPSPRLRERRPDLPAALVATVERAIEPDPSRRLAGARPLVEALEASASARRAPRFPARALAVIGVTALLAVAVIGVLRSRRAAVIEPAGTTSPVTPPSAGYTVEASFMRRDDRGATRLVTGDRVKPGDRLSLEFRSTRPAWVYVLDEDERGERYLLFPQPRFDVRNPLPADSTFVLPGPIVGEENAWTVTSAGGREYLLIVASPSPVPEIEADLGRLPAPLPGRPIDYAPVGSATVERLRGVGGITALPSEAGRSAPRSRAFDGFRALAGRETGIQGVWVRQIVLENPGR